MSKNIQNLSREYSKFLICKERNNEEKTKFISLSEDAPEDLKALIQNYHLKDHFTWPDDYIYDYFNNAFDTFPEYDEPECYLSEIEADYSNHELLKWMSSDSDRVIRVEDAIKEDGCFNNKWSLMEMIQAAQIKEKQEIAKVVLSFLQSKLEEAE